MQYDNMFTHASFMADNSGSQAWRSMSAPTKSFFKPTLECMLEVDEWCIGGAAACVTQRHMELRSPLLIESVVLSRECWPFRTCRNLLQS